MTTDVFDFAAPPTGRRIGPPLGERPRRMLREIARHSRDFGYGPTVREVALAAGISSTSVADYWLQRLRQAGYVTYTDGLSRTLRVTGLEPPAEPRR